MSSIGSNASQNNGMTELLVATRNNNIQLMRQLLQSGEDPNAFENRCRWTPLIAAASCDSPEAMQLLLDHNANIDWEGQDGSALTIAASYGNDSSVRFLLSRGARVDLFTSDGYGAAAFAVQNGHIVCLKLLLDAGADVNACTSDGHSLLLIAAHNKRPDATDLLLQRSADPNRPEKRFNWTPLITAVYENCESVVSLLIACSSTNLDQIGRDGTALALAAAKNNIPIATMLLQAGAQINVADYEGYTPLLWSALNDHHQMGRFLLENGASLMHENTAGQNAILIAACCGNQQTLKILLEAARNQRLQQSLSESVRRTLQMLSSSASDSQFDSNLRETIVRDLNAFVGSSRNFTNNNTNSPRGTVLPNINVSSSKSVADTSVDGGSIRGIHMRMVAFNPILPRQYLDSLGLQSDEMRFLNHGNFGWVYRAQKRDGEVLVLKLVSAASRDILSFAREDREVFSDHNRREIEIMKSLNHKNVVQFHSAELVGNYLVISMEFIPGYNLRALRSQQGGFNELTILNYLKQICDGIAYIHSLRVCHRDIKGENLMVKLPGNVVKIIDFGLSKRLHEHDNLHSHVGTPRWMAPEVFNSLSTGLKSQYNPLAADIYSLGCTLHELATGEPPSMHQTSPNSYELLQFDRNGNLSLNDLARFVSRSLCAIFQQCTNRTPENRPTVQQLQRHQIFRSIQ